MAKIEWDNPGDRYYHVGIDRGVLYPKSGPGVPWNGLSSVNENPTGGTAKPYYIDGFKYLNESTPEEFAGTIEAYTYPDEFSKIDGTYSSGSGLYYGQQVRESFGLCYRTFIGSDTEGLDNGYEIHLIYNALASPTSKSHSTVSNTVSPSTFSWNITSAPGLISSRKPTSHLVINSKETDPETLKDLEDILYGTYETARLPEITEIVTMFDDWPVLEISPNTSTGLNQLIFDGLSDLKGDTSVGLYEATDDTRLVERSTPGLYDLEV